MKKLTGLDASFLYNETARCPQTIASVQVFTLATGQTATDFLQQLRTRYAERLGAAPYLTRRLVQAALTGDHPVWVEAGTADLQQHITLEVLPAPGDRAALEATIARLHEQRLPRDRPLWRTVVLSGLAGNQVACYTALHHACVDGVGGQRAVEAIFEDTGEASSPIPAERVPGWLDLWLAGAGNLAQAGFRNFGSQAQRARAAIGMQQRAMDPSRGLGAFGDRAPRTPLNGMIHRERTYASGEIALEALRGVRKASGLTVNEVFLAACGGALRTYLARADALPTEDLIAGCPVSLRSADDASSTNQVTMMQVALGTAEIDDRERLACVQSSSAVAKGVLADAADLVECDPVALGLPAMLQVAARSAEVTGVAAQQAPFNVVISNVPGPRETITFGGATMESHWPVSIPAHGLGVNITVQSYAGTLYFGVTAAADALPDAGVLRDDLLSAFEDLKSIAGPQSTSAGARERPEMSARVAVAEAKAKAEAA